MENSLLTAEQARDLVMYHHEQTKKRYLYTARGLAERICRERGEVTINDVRALLPLPQDMHPSVLGAVLRDRRFTHSGKYTTAKHTASHARKIGVYTLRGNTQ